MKSVAGDMTPKAQPGTIGNEINRRRYVEHLIKRYNEFAFADPTRRGEFRYGVISKNLEDRFGAPWRILPVDRCEEVIPPLRSFLRSMVNRVTRIHSVVVDEKNAGEHRSDSYGRSL